MFSYWEEISKRNCKYVEIAVFFSAFMNLSLNTQKKFNVLEKYAERNETYSENIDK
jgi:hypothetical protein